MKRIQKIRTIIFGVIFLIAMILLTVGKQCEELSKMLQILSYSSANPRPDKLSADIGAFIILTLGVMEISIFIALIVPKDLLKKSKNKKHKS